MKADLAKRTRNPRNGRCVTEIETRSAKRTRNLENEIGIGIAKPRFADSKLGYANFASVRRSTAIFGFAARFWAPQRSLRLKDANFGSLAARTPEVDWLSGPFEAPKVR